VLELISVDVIAQAGSRVYDGSKLFPTNSASRERKHIVYFAATGEVTRTTKARYPGVHLRPGRGGAMHGSNHWAGPLCRAVSRRVLGVGDAREFRSIFTLRERDRSAAFQGNAAAALALSNDADAMDRRGR
jgi:hypothetical protein